MANTEYESKILERLALSSTEVEEEAETYIDDPSVALLHSTNSDNQEITAAVLTVPPQPQPPITKPVLPGRSASVNDVRQYITATLVTQHNTTLEYAQRTARKWQLGRGWSLRSLPAKRFNELFGDEIGPHLQWAVAEDKKTEELAHNRKLFEAWLKTRAFVAWRTVTIASIVMATLFFFATKAFSPPAAILAIPQVCFFFTLPHHDAMKTVVKLVFFLLLIMICGVAG